MADPLTLTFVAATCAWGLLKGASSYAGGQAARHVVDALRNSWSSDGQDVLEATHAAFLTSLDTMAGACAEVGGDAIDHFSARALAGLVGDSGFRSLTASIGTFPQTELQERIRSIFEESGA